LELHRGELSSQASKYSSSRWLALGPYLVLVPEGLLGACLGDVFGGLADEAALTGSHPRNPQRVLRPPAATLLGLLEHALLVFLALLFGAVGGRRRLGRAEVGVRLAEALPRQPLPLVYHRWIRLPASVSRRGSTVVSLSAAAAGGRKKGIG
jgi:hypothetical protein